MQDTRRAFSGSKIREARHTAGLTQAALARAINTRERNIIRWENDQHEPRFEHVAAIAKVTGKTLDFFAADQPEAPTEPDSEAALLARSHGPGRSMLETLYDELAQALGKTPSLSSERGSIAPTLITWGVAFLLLATGWTI